MKNRKDMSPSRYDNRYEVVAANLIIGVGGFASQSTYWFVYYVVYNHLEINWLEAVYNLHSIRL